MNVDAILRQIGEFGVYQKAVYLALNLFGITHGCRMLMAVFMLYTPQHRCAIPSYPNDTYEVQSPYHARLISRFVPNNTEDDEEDIPYDQCHLYAPSFRLSTGGASNVTGGHADRTMTGCQDGWVYDKSIFENTAVVEFDMVCDDSLLGSHSQTSQMLGYFFGVIIIGAIGDKWGRKVAIYLSVLIYAASGLGLSWTPQANYGVFVMTRFFNGAASAGMFTAACVLSVELVGPSKRIYVGVLIHLAFAIGGVVLSLVGYLIRDWALINIVSVAPVFLALTFWWVIPESPRWLARKGQTKEAEQILRKIAKYNGKTFPEKSFSDAAQENGGPKAVDQSNAALEKGEDKDPKQVNFNESNNNAAEVASNNRMPPEEHEGGPMRNFLRMFSYRVLVIRNVIMFMNWFVVSMAYYGLSFTASQLSTGDLFSNFLLSMAMDFPANILALLLLDRLGRRKLHILSMLLGAVGCLVGVLTTMVVPDAYQWVTVVVAMLGKLGSSCSFITVYVYSSELLPTTVRSAGIGTSSAFARLGSILASYVQQWSLEMGGDIGHALPMLVFGTGSLATGLLTLMLPETLHKDLPDTVEDALTFGRDPAKDETRDPIKTVEAYTLPGQVEVEMETYITPPPSPPPFHHPAAPNGFTKLASSTRAESDDEAPPDADVKNAADKSHHETANPVNEPSGNEVTAASENERGLAPDVKRTPEEDASRIPGVNDTQVLSENDKLEPEDDARVLENDARVPGREKRLTEDDDRIEAGDTDHGSAGMARRRLSANSPKNSGKRMHFTDAIQPAECYRTFTEGSAHASNSALKPDDNNATSLSYKF